MRPLDRPVRGRAEAAGARQQQRRREQSVDSGADRDRACRSQQRKQDERGQQRAPIPPAVFQALTRPKAPPTSPRARPGGRRTGTPLPSGTRPAPPRRAGRSKARGVTPSAGAAGDCASSAEPASSAMAARRLDPAQREQPAGGCARRTLRRRGCPPRDRRGRARARKPMRAARSRGAATTCAPPAPRRRGWPRPPRSPARAPLPRRERPPASAASAGRTVDPLDRISRAGPRPAADQRRRADRRRCQRGREQRRAQAERRDRPDGDPDPGHGAQRIGADDPAGAPRRIPGARAHQRREACPRAVWWREADCPQRRSSAGPDARSIRPCVSASSGSSVAAASAPAPISSTPYQRRGEAERSARGPSQRAPSASPPKKATNTAEMASTWLPAASATRRVHTTWYTRAGAPEKSASSSAAKAGSLPMCGLRSAPGRAQNLRG